MTRLLRLLATTGAVAALALSLGTPIPSATAIPVDRGGEATATGSERPGLLQKGPPRHPIAAARAATRKYKSLARAKADGRTVLRDKDGIACIAMPGMGGMGVHLVQGALVGTPRVRVRRPEALVYARGRDGKPHLVALEYVVLRQDWERVHGPDARRPRLFGRRFDFTSSDNRFGLPAFYSLHAWVWKDNPAGMFAPFNPNVKCCHCGSQHQHQGGHQH